MGYTIDKLLVSEARKMFRDGFAIKEISKKLNLKETTVYRRVQDIRESKRTNDVMKFKNNLNKLSDYEKGYIAGMLDGEGSILIHTAGTTEGKKVGKIFYSALINFSNQDIEILNFIQDKLKLNTKIGLTGETVGGKCYMLNIYGKDMIRPFCEYIIPFSHSVKTRKRANIMIKFCESRDQKERRELYMQMRVANFTGKARAWKYINHKEKSYSKY